MLEPSAVILYVNDLTVSSKFYQDLLGIKPEELSPTFTKFTLSNGMGLGLKIQPKPSTGDNSSGELAFSLNSHLEVDTLFTQWQQKGISIAAPPALLPFGYTFLALDPDGNHLRFVALTNSME